MKFCRSSHIIKDIKVGKILQDEHVRIIRLDSCISPKFVKKL